VLVDLEDLDHLILLDLQVILLFFQQLHLQEVEVVEFILEMFQVVVVDQEVEEVEVDLLVQEIHLQQILLKEIVVE